MMGEIETAGLVYIKATKNQYGQIQNQFFHTSRAAIQLVPTNGKQPVKGDIIQYIYTNNEHQNPLSRVVTAGNSYDNSGLEYDKEKYKEMLLDAA